jgi:hypothetical protein
MLLPALELKVTAGLVCIPGVLAVTSTVTVQDEKLASSASESVMVEPPLGALKLPAESRGQSVEAIAGSAIITAAGKASVKAILVTGVPLPLVIVNVIVLTLPGPIVSGVKTLLSVGCA